MEKGLRYNEGKTRLGLIPTSAIEGIGKVLTYGANKYTVKDADGNIVIDGANNWKKGLPWMEVIDSLERHLTAFKNGEDIDPESNCYHVDHLLTNAAFLKEFYKIYPQGDNRPHKYLKMPRIGLDIDEVLCDWVGGWMELRGIKERPHSWLFDRAISEEFKKMEAEGTLKDFMLSLKPLIDPRDLPFEPTCYITARHCDNMISQEWLDMHGFPTAPVFSTGNKCKSDIAKEMKLDIFVDDNFKNFVNLNNAGVCCYLWDAPHNKKYNVGFKRIYSLNELV
jgi:5'(3')-deoxyribonucleotidase